MFGVNVAFNEVKHSIQSNATLIRIKCHIDPTKCHIDPIKCHIDPIKCHHSF